MMVGRNTELSDRTAFSANSFQRDIKDGRFEQRMHKGLDTLLRVAAYKLKRMGYKKEAAELIAEWEGQYSFDYVMRLSGESKHIGDHAPVSLWLKEKMDMLIFLMGAEIAYNLRISDISTFNETPKVILFCSDHVDEDEYRLHWVHDSEVYKRGLAPTVAFWFSSSICLGASLTTGFLFCQPISMGIEWLVKKYVAPNTNRFMWQRACQ